MHCCSKTLVSFHAISRLSFATLTVLIKFGVRNAPLILAESGHMTCPLLYSRPLQSNLSLAQGACTTPRQVMLLSLSILSQMQDWLSFHCQTIHVCQLFHARARNRQAPYPTCRSDPILTSAQNVGKHSMLTYRSISACASTQFCVNIKRGFWNSRLF